MDTLPNAPIIRTQSDLERAWRTLVHPLGWSGRRLWLLVIGPDDRPIPVMNEITDLPDRLGPDDAGAVGRLCRRVRDDVVPDARVALLLCRPGAGVPDPDDRASAAALYEAMRRAGVPMEVVHLATDRDFHPMPHDAVDPPAG